MEKKEAGIRFAKADKLFTVGRFEDALVELEAIDTHFPNNHRILNAQARTLEQLRRYDRALAVCDRLLHDFNYEKVRPLRDRIAATLEPPPQQHTSSPPLPVARKEKSNTVSDNSKRFRIKPVRLLFLIAIVALTYLDYIPVALGVGLILGYFIVKLLIGAAIRRLFSAPFKMKGKALSGAIVELHGYEWTDAPVHDNDSGDDSDDDFEDDEPEVPRRYVWLDLTITPPDRSEGFTAWEPGELMLAPANLEISGLDSLDACFGVHDVRVLVEGVEQEDDEGKYGGPQRIKLLVGLPHDVSEFCLVYYFEQFGRFQLV